MLRYYNFVPPFLNCVITFIYFVLYFLNLVKLLINYIADNFKTLITMPSLTKMQNSMSKSAPHIGQMVARVIADRNISKSQLARWLQIHPSGIDRYLKQSTLHVALLWKLGEVLQYNFFAALMQEFPIAHVSEKDVQEKQQLQQQIIDLQKENELYQKVLRITNGK
jgi:plasmid maintenance system antidote protein VapI